jgi:hypothetical protein
MELKEAIKMCEDNGMMVIEIDKAINQDRLSFNVVLKIAARINKVDANDIIKPIRGNDRIVNSRWLAIHYIYSTTPYTHSDIAKKFNKDRATIIHTLKGNSSPFLNGWRQKNKELFLMKINELHRSLGLSEFTYKEYNKL